MSQSEPTAAHTASASLLMALARGWALASSALVLLLSARFMPPEQVGYFALAAAVTVSLNILVGAGFQEWVLRERDDPHAADRAFFASLGVAVLVMLLAFGFAWGARQLFPDAPMVARLVMMLAPTALAWAWVSIASAVLMRNGRLLAYAGIALLCDTAGLIAGVAGLFLGWQEYALAAHRLTTIAVCAPALMIATRWLPNPAVPWTGFGAMLRYAWEIIMLRFLQVAQGSGVDVLIGVLLTPAATAMFRLGARLVQLVSEVIQQPLETLAWVRFSAARQRGAEPLRDEITRFTRAVAVVGAGAFVGMACVMPLLIGLVLGPAWEGAAIVGVVMALTKALTLVSAPSIPAIGSTDGTKWLPRLQLLTGLLSVALVLVAAPYGLTAVVASQAAPQLLLAPVLLWLQSRLDALDALAVMRTMLVSAACAAIMAAAVLGADMALSQLPLMDVARLGALVLIGAGVYLGAAALLAREAVRPLMEGARAIVGAAFRRIGLISAADQNR